MTVGQSTMDSMSAGTEYDGDLHSQAPAGGKTADTEESQQVRYRVANFTQGSLVRREEEKDTTSSPATGTLAPDQKRDLSSGLPHEDMINLHSLAASQGLGVAGYMKAGFWRGIEALKL